MMSFRDVEVRVETAIGAAVLEEMITFLHAQNISLWGSQKPRET